MVKSPSDTALSALESLRQAVKEAIEENHRRGLPVYQRHGDYIVAVHPGNRIVKLEKVRKRERCQYCGKI